MGCKRTSKFKSGTRLQIRNLRNSIDVSNELERGMMLNYLRNNMYNFQDWYCVLHKLRMNGSDAEYEQAILNKYYEIWYLTNNE